MTHTLDSISNRFACCRSNVFSREIGGGLLSLRPAPGLRACFLAALAPCNRKAQS